MIKKSVHFDYIDEVQDSLSGVSEEVKSVVCCCIGGVGGVGLHRLQPRKIAIICQSWRGEGGRQTPQLPKEARICGRSIDRAKTVGGLRTAKSDTSEKYK